MDTCPHICKLWPHTLFCGETTCARPGKKWEEGCGIVTEAAMRGILLGACSVLGRPGALLQKKPDGCLMCGESVFCPDKKCKEGENCFDPPADPVTDSFFRLESMVFYEHSSSLCWDLRDQTKGKPNCQTHKCFGMDARIADYLLAHAKDEDKPDGVFDLLLDMHGVEEAENLESTKARWIKIDEIIGLRYKCPYSGYSELAFLIKVDEIQAVLFIGQMLFDGEEEGLQDRAQVRRCLATVERHTTPKLKEPEHAALLDIFVERRLKHSKSDKTEEGFLKDVSEAIDKLRKEIKTRADNRWDMLRGIIVKRAIKEFDRLAKTRLDVLHEEQEGLAPPERINAEYKVICETMCDIIANENESPEHPWLNGYMGLEVRREDVFIDPEQFRPTDPALGYAAKGNQIDIDFKIEKDGCYHFHKHVPNGICLPDIVIKRWKDQYGVLEDNNPLKLKDRIQDIVSDLYDHFYLLASGLTQFHAEHNQAFTAFMRHELGQSHGGMLLALETHEVRLKRLEERLKIEGRSRDAEDVSYIMRDYNEYLHDSVLRVNSTRYMNSIPDPSYDYFLPYKGFLFKWKAIYRVRAKNDQKAFFMVNPSEEAYSLRPYMEADRDMMEQAAYNLTNNAFKYARFGTTVMLDCKLSNDSRDWYDLTVTNYGVSIPEEEFEQLGNYGFRASNHDRGEGGGLGLWHCKEIAKKHGGELLKDMKELSPFDITSLLTFEEMTEGEKRFVISKLEKDGEKRQALQEGIEAELHRLKKLPDWEQIDSGLLQGSNSFTPPNVVKMMRRGTTKYTFIIRIPIRRPDHD